MFFFSAFVFFANHANALMKWTAPSRPSNVPKEFDSAILQLTNWLLGFVSLIGVLVVIWGGVNYLTSAGNEDQVRTAKDIIKYGLMGIVIAGLAYAVVNVIVTTILK